MHSSANLNVPANLYRNNFDTTSQHKLHEHSAITVQLLQAHLTWEGVNQSEHLSRTKDSYLFLNLTLN